MDIENNLKARGKCVKLLKLHQTNEFDGQFDAFALTIKRDFFGKMKKEGKKSCLMKFDGE